MISIINQMNDAIHKDMTRNINNKLYKKIYNDNLAVTFWMISDKINNEIDSKIYWEIKDKIWYEIYKELNIKS